MTIDFENDTAFIFGQKAKLIVTKSGHYALPISPYTQLLNNLATNEMIHITLTTQGEKSKFQMAIKLHSFSHPPPEKLVKLLNSAGEQWRNDEDLKQAIKQISSDCKICQLYQKPPPRSIVGLPMASTFQECVAMDLEFYRGKILLHFEDHATRLSVIPPKDLGIITKYIFKIWIQIYDSAEKFLTDNGGEFANQELMDMCEAMNIIVKKTAAEAPFSNGLTERHNLILSEMLDRTLEDNKIDLELALAWCINAKNSLANVHGFSPF